MIDYTEKEIELQLKRESECADAGFKRFNDNQINQCKLSDGSNTAFGIYHKSTLLPRIIKNLQDYLDDIKGVRSSRVKVSLKKCVCPTLSKDGSTKPFDYWDLEVAAFLAFQLTLDTALNPNHFTHRVINKTGGDKKLLQKRNVGELEVHIARVVEQQMGLRVLEKSFPDWFRKANKFAEGGRHSNLRATTSYWQSNMIRQINQFKADIQKEGDDVALEIVDGRKPWNRDDREIIGAWLLKGVIEATELFTIKLERYGKQSSSEIYLSSFGLQRKEELEEHCKDYEHDLLPMVIPPQPVTNETLGGWLNPVLQQPDKNPNGSIELSDKHLEFINRQARVKYQINPFTFHLFERLIEEDLSLGKFYYYRKKEAPELNQLLGYGDITDRDEQSRLVKNHPDNKKWRQWLAIFHEQNREKAEKGLLAIKLVEKVKKILNDEYNYIPISYDFRGRIYSRVPFTSFQAADPGRYLLRFAEKTPIDDRTLHWFKIGISNAAGNDKLNFQDRIKWFDKYRSEIINVGRMLEPDGDFKRAYDFLTQDYIDDPFCLAALANEYVKCHVDKSQNYTQCYVCVDASCSGSAIFNAWRKNKAGGEMVNLTNTSKPADIYMEIWLKIKDLAKPGTFKPEHIKRLEDTKLIRKMMKVAFIPAQYASPENRQFYALTKFNNKQLKKAELQFSPEEMESLKELWSLALDEVSSISTVIEWFRERSQEALDAGATELYYTSLTGSRMTLRYPKFEEHRVKTIHFGQTKQRQRRQKHETPEVNTKKMLNSITANLTHLTDATALCEAMWDWEQPFVSIHDAIGLPISSAIDKGIQQLKEGFIRATEYDVWTRFRQDNNLPINPQTAPPVVKDLDLSEILDSDYLFS